VQIGRRDYFKFKKSKCSRQFELPEIKMEQQFFDFCFNIRDPAEVDQRQTFEIDTVKEQIVGTGDIFYINLVGNRGKVQTAEEQTADISNIFFKFNLKIYFFSVRQRREYWCGFPD